jgi:predicted dinucleotide-binding enzyme
MEIGIIGAGAMGMTLSRHLCRLGHQVSIASPRGPAKLVAFAAEIGASAVSVDEAIEVARVAVLAIPTKLVVDLGNYHSELRDGHIDAIDLGLLGSQWVAQRIGRPVVKAFNNIFAASLLEKGALKGTPGRIAAASPNTVQQRRHGSEVPSPHAPRPQKRSSA